MKRLRSLLLVALWLSVGLAFAGPPLHASAGSDPKGSPAVSGWPSSMASTGDSITRAYNTGSFPFSDAPANSWSTGTNATVNSHYSRILAAFPGISGHNFNDAVTGAKMTDLNGQIATVNTQHVDYVTILLGANDACTPTEADMIPVATYRAQFQAALNTLAAGSPDARVYVLSVPNIYNLWSILHDNSSARSTWGLLSICQSMLANPQSTAQADVDRRNRVLQRVVDYNTQLAQVCAANVHCRFDNNVVFNTAFVPSDVTTRDYFHPTVAGQAKLSTATYAAGFDFTDSIPPTSWATLSAPFPPLPAVPQAVMVALSASDNVGVSGIEYKLDGGPYTRYDRGIPLNPGSTLTYRAVDVNGNVEASHTLQPQPPAQLGKAATARQSSLHVLAL
ncbi:MAG: SGNH/GDSL hydrolase family protein [Chloroflexia bacterium]